MSKAAKNAAETMLAYALKELKAQLKVVKRRRMELDKTKGFDPEVHRSAAQLAAQVKALLSEQRQQEKHSSVMDANLSDDELVELMVARLAELPYEHRQNVERRLRALNDKKVT